MTHEVMVVRPDEQVDLQALQAYLAAHLPACSGTLTLQQFHGGHANLTYLLRLGTQSWVLRRPPLGPTLPTAHDMRREFRILSALAQTDVPAPRPLLLCEDPQIIGAPFYLMEQQHGYILRDVIPPELGEDHATRRQLSEATVDALAQIHAVPWQDVGLHDFGRSTGYLERQLRRWPAQWERAKTRPLPALERVQAWLQQHVPPASRTTIVHGDYKLDNLMFQGDCPVRVSAILDWEMSTLGDPLADLGWLLAYWPQPGDSVNRTSCWRPLTTAPGFLRRAELVARYEERTGRRATGIDFYEVLGLYKNAVILEGIYARFVAGHTQDERFAQFGPQVVLYADAALECAAHARL